MDKCIIKGLSAVNVAQATRCSFVDLHLNKHYAQFAICSGTARVYILSRACCRFIRPFLRGHVNLVKSSRKPRKRVFKLVKREIEFARRHNVKVALESFCYRPFVFRNIGDFGQFV